MTIHARLPETAGYKVTRHDIEILPVNDIYSTNAFNPTISVLVNHGLGAITSGEVVLFDAITGGLLESIGEIANPAMEDSMVYFLDTDDHDCVIHVTGTDAAGNTMATVFSYI